MRWHLWGRAEPDIPPAPEVDTDHDRANRMEDLGKNRQRRADRVTRRTQVVRAQNGFVTTFKNSLE